MVLELTRQGEARADEGTLEAALTEALGAESDFPVFIPASTYIRDGERVTIHLMEGYAFVASGLPEGAYFGLERECQYVRRVLSNQNSDGIPALHVISDSDVQEMCRQLRTAVSQDIEDGMQVRITQGAYAKLEGMVVGMEGEDAFVHVKLRSFEVIRTVPKVFLEPFAEEGSP